MATSNNSGIFSFPEFKNRGIIKLAPDALVYIGGSTTIQVIAPASSSGINGKLDFNDGITSISVQNVNDPPGSSTASIEVTAPIYGENSKYWVNFPTAYSAGNVTAVTRMPVFTPMMEVKIFFKGRFMLDTPNALTPVYYPAFWGLLTAVEENYSGGVHKISLRCVDMLHWWAYSTITFHPVPESNIAAGFGQTITPYASIFELANPFSIIKRLFENMGMDEFVAPTWLAQLTPLQTIFPQDQIKKLPHIMDYWRNRFKSFGALLKMFGIRGEDITSKVMGTDNIQVWNPSGLKVPDTSKNSKAQASTKQQNVQNYTVDNRFLSNFQVFADLTQMGSFDQAEKQTKLQIATIVAQRCEYEFYQDCNGNFIFKPPFYNMDVRGLQPYEIEPQDVINSAFHVDTEGICTVLQVHGSMFQNMYSTSYARPEGYHIDIELMQKYGLRYQEMQVQYVAGDAGVTLARQLAVGHMNRMNAKTMTGSVTIPGRPEIRLGYPVYIKHRDSFHYVKSITHGFDYGGTFTTTLSLETERKKTYLPSGDSWALQLNKVYLYTGQILASDTAGTASPPTLGQLTDAEKKKAEIDQANNKVASLRQGLYSITDRLNDDQLAITNNSVPFTDDDGYRVIGSFPYGRGVNPVNIDDPTYYKYNDSIKNVIDMKVGSLLEAYRMDAINTIPEKETIQPNYMDAYSGSNSIVSAETDFPVTTNSTTQGTFVTPDQPEYNPLPNFLPSYLNNSNYTTVQSIGISGNSPAPNTTLVGNVQNQTNATTK
jgi:hypothetical protein